MARLRDSLYRWKVSLVGWGTSRRIHLNICALSRDLPYHRLHCVVQSAQACTTHSCVTLDRFPAVARYFRSISTLPARCIFCRAVRQPLVPSSGGMASTPAGLRLLSFTDAHAAVPLRVVRITTRRCLRRYLLFIAARRAIGCARSVDQSAGMTVVRSLLRGGECGRQACDASQSWPGWRL